jgi:competence protein ComEA
MKRFLSGLLLALVTLVAQAAVDVNKATQAELESIKGIGPAVSTRILDERKKSAFKDWTDLIDRVKGVGPGNAVRYSEAGLTVGGDTYAGDARTKTTSKKLPVASTGTSAAVPVKEDKK